MPQLRQRAGASAEEAREPPICAPAQLDRLGRMVIVGGVLCAAGGLMVVLAWYVNSLWMLRANADATPIVFNTGVAFVLIGVALVACVLGRDRLALLGAVVTAALGVVTLLEHAMGRGLGIDQLVFRTSVTGPSGSPGRIAPNTALCFLVVGAALVWRVRGPARGRTVVTGVSAGIVLAIAGAAGAGYASGQTGAYQWGRVTAMALPTSGLLILVGAVLFTLVWRDPHREAAENDMDTGVDAVPLRARRWTVRRVVASLAILVYLPLGLLAYVSVTLASQAVAREAEATVRNAASLEAHAVLLQMDGMSALAASFATRARIVAALDDAKAGTLDVAALQAVLDETILVEPGVASLGITDANGILLAVSPATPEAIGHDFSFRDWYKGASRTGDTYVSEAVQTATAGHPLVVAVATPIRSRPGGPVVGYLSLGYLLTAIQDFTRTFNMSKQVSLSVTDQRGVVVASGNQPVGLVSVVGDEPVRRALAGMTGVLSDDTPDGRQIVGYAPVGDIGWTVTAGFAESVALERIAQLRAAVVGIALVLAAALTVALVLLARTLRDRAVAESTRSKAEDRERTAARYARSLIEASLDPLVTISPDGQITDVNEATVQATGVDRKLLIGSDFTGYFTEPDKAREGYSKVFADGFITDYPLTLRHTNGSLIDVITNASVYKDTSGNVVGVFVAARDVTERKRTEQELFKSEQRYRGLIESQQELIIRVDRAGRYTFANDAYCAKYGFDRDAILGTSNLPSVVHPDDVAAATQALQCLDRPPYRSYVELRTFAVGGERWVGWEDYAIRDASGEVVEFQSVGRDIDDRKRAEAELTQRTHELEQAAMMLDALPERVNRYRVSDHAIVYCNAAWATQYNVEPAAAIGRPLDEFLSADELDGLHSQLALLGPDNPTLVDNVARAVHNAPGHFLEWADQYLTSDDGAEVLSVGRDVTGRHDAELKLAESEARFRNLADKSADVVWRFLIKPTPHFDYMSPSVENILGYPPSYFLDDFTRMLDILDQAGNTTIERALRGERILGRFDFRFRHANGSIVVGETRTSAINGGLQGVSRDVTELRLLQETTAALALHDPLTGLANRRLFIELLDADLARTERSGLPLAVAFIDLDDFKNVNDAFGHDVGDLVLCETSRRLQSIVRGADTVARLGGDEFVVVYEPNDVNSNNLTRRIDQSLSQPLNVAPTIIVSCQASIGISNTSTVGYNSAALLAAADAAMYEVKRARQTVRDAEERLHPTSVS